MADCNEAIRLNPTLAVAYINRALAWNKKKVYDKAIADYNEAIRLDPQHPLAYNGLAWLWAMCPDEMHLNGQRAVESALRACELDGWREWNYIGTLGAAYAEKGDFHNAIKYGEKALSMAPEEEKTKARDRLDAYRAGKPWREP